MSPVTSRGSVLPMMTWLRLSTWKSIWLTVLELNVFSGLSKRAIISYYQLRQTNTRSQLGITTHCSHTLLEVCLSVYPSHIISLQSLSSSCVRTTLKRDWWCHEEETGFTPNHDIISSLAFSCSGLGRCWWKQTHEMCVPETEKPTDAFHDHTKSTSESHFTNFSSHEVIELKILFLLMCL